MEQTDKIDQIFGEGPTHAVHLAEPSQYFEKLANSPPIIERTFSPLTSPSYRESAPEPDYDKVLPRNNLAGQKHRNREPLQPPQ